MQCSTHSNDDNSGLVKWIAKRQDGAGTETPSASAEASHDGAGVNDQFGKWVWYVNTGAGLVEGIRLDSNLDVIIAGNTDLASGKVFKVNGTQVVGARVIDARADDALNSGDATTDGVIDALRDAMITHGLIAAA